MSRALLMILDGWGLGSDPSVSAIAEADTPFMDRCMHSYAWSELITSGKTVGLPEGQMGNSEVGHTHIGAGRVIDQDLLRINKEIRSGRFFKHKQLRLLLKEVQKRGRNLHFIGLISEGGVHAQVEHLEALAKLAHQSGCNRSYVHAFLDGRDMPPYSGADLLSRLEPRLSIFGTRIATCMGRYYAMDRDQRWARTEKAYKALISYEGAPVCSGIERYLEDCYKKGQSDEFIEPQILCNEVGEPYPRLQSEDLLVCFNFRPDRMRQLVELLTQDSCSMRRSRRITLRCATMTAYDERFEGIEILYKTHLLSHTLGEVVADAGLKQLRIAETEKYPHVTFFFSGGREQPFANEERILCPSPKVATYDLQPEMSAGEITRHLLSILEKKRFNFICLNFANADMVGHTGIMDAATRACTFVDKCAEQVAITAQRSGYHVLIIADHGNAERMRMADGTPHTAHTTNPVPCVLMPTKGLKVTSLRNGMLIDVAPTLLHLMGLEVPREMSGDLLYNQNV